MDVIFGNRQLAVISFLILEDSSKTKKKKKKKKISYFKIKMLVKVMKRSRLEDNQKICYPLSPCCRH